MSTLSHLIFNKKAFLVLAAMSLLTLTSCRQKPKQKDYDAWLNKAVQDAGQKTKGAGQYVEGLSNIPPITEKCQKSDNGEVVIWGVGEITRHVWKDPYATESNDQWYQVGNFPYLIVTKKCKMKKWDQEAFCQVLFYDEEELQTLLKGISMQSRTTNFNDYDKVVEFIKTHEPKARYVYATGSLGKGLGKAHTVTTLKESRYDIATLRGFEFARYGSLYNRTITNICRLGSYYLGWFMWIAGVVLLCVAFAILKKSTLINELKFGDKAMRKRFPVTTTLKALLYLCLFFSLSVGISAGLFNLDNYKMQGGFNMFLSDLVEVGYGIALILLAAFVIVGLVKKYPFKNIILAVLGVLVTMLGLVLLAQPFGLVAKILGWILFIASLPLLIWMGAAAIGGIIDGELDEATFKLDDGTIVRGRGSRFEDSSGHVYTKDGSTFTREH